VGAGPRASRTLPIVAVGIVSLGLVAARLVWRPGAPGTPITPAGPAVVATGPAAWRIAVTGTGPGLAWVADRQVAWAGNAVTGTGPGLVYLANLQTHLRPAVTGTGPGLLQVAERQPSGVDRAIIGTP